MTMPNIGDEFAGYKIESLLGRGGMGVVYKAEHLRLRRKVALKLLAAELATDEVFRQRFMAESQVAASIDHPNIIPIYEADEEDALLFIAMRFVQGQDLKERLKRGGPLEPHTTIAWLTQIAGALDCAHERGLVHRDVKPQNILITAGSGHESEFHCYLTDFGLTKQVAATSGFTAAGHFVGTIDYIAPEQMEGKRLDPRTDVYALGCVLYECLSGNVPFPKDSEVSIMYAHMQEPPPRLSEARPDLPAGIGDVVARAMAKAPDDRFGSCQELVSAAKHELQREREDMQPVPTGGQTVAAGGLAGIAAGAAAGGFAPGAGSGETVAGGAGVTAAAASSDPRMQQGATQPGWQQGGGATQPGWQQGGGGSGGGYGPGGGGGGYGGPGGPAGPGGPGGPGYSGGGPGAPGKPNRGALWAILGVVALLVIGGGVFFLTQGGDDEEEPEAAETTAVATTAAATTAPPTTAAPTATVGPTVTAPPTAEDTGGGGDDFPNLIEAQLLEHIPGNIRDTCIRTDIELAPRTTAAISCFPPDVFFVNYIQFDNDSAMNREYNEAVSGAGALKDSGSCQTDNLAEGAYTRGGRTIGRILCYVEGGQATIEWTNNLLTVYGQAARDDNNLSALFDFWATAGPNTRGTP